jgi:hypothetical protein
MLPRAHQTLGAPPKPAKMQAPEFTRAPDPSESVRRLQGSWTREKIPDSISYLSTNGATIAIRESFELTVCRAGAIKRPCLPRLARQRRYRACPGMLS